MGAPVAMPKGVYTRKLYMKTSAKTERNLQVVAAHDAGYSQYKIADMVGISRSAVCMILRRDKNIERIRENLRTKLISKVE